MRRFGAVLVLLSHVFALAAIVSTTTGNIVAEVLSIDKAGVTIRARLGTTVFKPSDVKYVLMDESRTDLIGRPGVVLKDGLIFHGEPNQITATSGTIVTDYGIIPTNLSNIVYFSYARYPDYDRFASITLGLLPSIVGGTSEKAFVTLVNGSKIEISDFKMTQDGTMTRFVFTGVAGTYVFSSNFINMIEVTLKETAAFQHYVETKNGAVFLCNLIFSGDNVVLELPYGNRLILKLSDLSTIAARGYYSPPSSRLLISGRYVPSGYRFDTSNRTLTILPYAELISIGNRMFTSVSLTIPK